MSQDPASIRYNNPGAMWGGNALTRKWGETGNIALNDGLHQNNHIAVFPDKVHGAAAQFDLWHTSRNYHNQQLAHAIRTWSGGNSWPEYVHLIAKLAPGLTATTVVNDALLAGSEGLALMKAQAQQEAGRPYPLTDAEWRQAQLMVFRHPPAHQRRSEMRKPDIRCVTEVVRDAQECGAGLPDGRYVPARSYARNQLCWYGRFKAVWLVFSGRADAVTYPGQ